MQHQGHRRRHRREVIGIEPSGLRSAVELRPRARKFAVGREMSCSNVIVERGKARGSGKLCPLPSTTPASALDRSACDGLARRERALRHGVSPRSATKHGNIYVQRANLDLPIPWAAYLPRAARQRTKDPCVSGADAIGRAPHTVHAVPVPSKKRVRFPSSL